MISNNKISGIDLVYSNYNIILFNEITKNNYGISLYDSISPVINYNNIYKNKWRGIQLIGSAIQNNFRHNWWGSRFGPSGMFKLFGDRVIYTEDGSKPKKISFAIRYYTCIPWEKQKIDFNNF